MNESGGQWNLPEPPFTLAIPSTDGNIRFGDLRLLHIPRSSIPFDKIMSAIISYDYEAGVMSVGGRTTLYEVSQGSVSPG